MKPIMTERDLPTVYNPQVVRTCPRCHRRFYQFTEGGRLVAADGTVTENTSARRTINCIDCGHRWTGRLTRSERGIE